MDSQSLQDFKTQEDNDTKKEFKKDNQKLSHIKEKKSRLCKKCFSPLEEGAIFCTHCGEKIEGVEKICPI